MASSPPEGRLTVHSPAADVTGSTGGTVSFPYLEGRARNRAAAPRGGTEMLRDLTFGSTSEPARLGSNACGRLATLVDASASASLADGLGVYATGAVFRDW